MLATLLLTWHMQQLLSALFMAGHAVRPKEQQYNDRLRGHNVTTAYSNTQYFDFVQYPTDNDTLCRTSMYVCVNILLYIYAYALMCLNL